MDGTQEIDPETGEVHDEAPPPIDIRTLTGDLRDAALGWIRSLAKPWAAMSELQQREIGYSVAAAASDIVRRAVELLAARDMENVIVRFADCKVKSTKDGAVIEGKVWMLYTPEAMEFFASRVGGRVVLVGADSDEYMGERGPADTDPDEPPLPMDDKPVADACDALADGKSRRR